MSQGLGVGALALNRRRMLMGVGMANWWLWERGSLPWLAGNPVLQRV